MTNAIRVDHINENIFISESFSKAAMNPTSREYKDLKEVMTTHPNYKICKRSIKKNENKKTYSGLTYDYMRQYIILHSSKENEASDLCEFEEMVLISQCHSKNYRYPTIKKWFLAKYPEVADFGTIEVEQNTKTTKNEKIAV